LGQLEAPVGRGFEDTSKALENLSSTLQGAAERSDVRELREAVERTKAPLAVFLALTSLTLVVLLAVVGLRSRASHRSTP